MIHAKANLGVSKVEDGRKVSPETLARVVNEELVDDLGANLVDKGIPEAPFWGIKAFEKLSRGGRGSRSRSGSTAYAAAEERNWRR